MRAAEAQTGKLADDAPVNNGEAFLVQGLVALAVEQSDKAGEQHVGASGRAKERVSMGGPAMLS